MVKNRSQDCFLRKKKLELIASTSARSKPTSLANKYPLSSCAFYSSRHVYFTPRMPGSVVNTKGKRKIKNWNREVREELVSIDSGVVIYRTGCLAWKAVSTSSFLRDYRRERRKQILSRTRELIPGVLHSSFNASEMRGSSERGCSYIFRDVSYYRDRRVKINLATASRKRGEEISSRDSLRFHNVIKVKRELRDSVAQGDTRQRGKKRTIEKERRQKMEQVVLPRPPKHSETRCEGSMRSAGKDSL